MLRITIHDDAEFKTFQLEGKLAGPWVQEAQVCWQRSLGALADQHVRLDLSGVTLIDAAGKGFLAAAHEQGAVLVATDCLMRAIVAGITNTPISNGACPHSMR